MSVSQSLTQEQIQANGALLEKVITSSDLAGLSPFEKVSHIKNVCSSLGLNPLTKPIQLIKFQGKEVMYMTKDATEQLRKNHNVSISKVENKILSDIYIVTVHATTPDGRMDASTGAISIAGLKGEALCNAMLKAETKAKRRVTLSICGLGLIDECEAESIPHARKVDVHEQAKIEVLTDSTDQNEFDSVDLNADIERICTAGNIAELEDAFKTAYKYWVGKKDRERLKLITEAKDKRKGELQVIEFNAEIDADTGEVIQ